MSTRVSPERHIKKVRKMHPRRKKRKAKALVVPLLKTRRETFGGAVGEKLVWLHFPFPPSLFFGDQISVSASEVKEVVEEEEEALQYCQSRQGTEWECSVKVCTEVQEDNVTSKREMVAKITFLFCGEADGVFCSCCVPL